MLIYLLMQLLPDQKQPSGELFMKLRRMFCGKKNILALLKIK